MSRFDASQDAMLNDSAAAAANYAAAHQRLSEAMSSAYRKLSWLVNFYRHRIVPDSLESFSGYLENQEKLTSELARLNDSIFKFLQDIQRNTQIKSDEIIFFSAKLYVHLCKLDAVSFCLPSDEAKQKKIIVSLLHCALVQFFKACFQLDENRFSIFRNFLSVPDSPIGLDVEKYLVSVKARIARTGIDTEVFSSSDLNCLESRLSLVLHDVRFSTPNLITADDLIFFPTLSTARFVSFMRSWIEETRIDTNDNITLKNKFALSEIFNRCIAELTPEMPAANSGGFIPQASAMFGVIGSYIPRLSIFTAQQQTQAAPQPTGVALLIRELRKIDLLIKAAKDAKELLAALNQLFLIEGATAFRAKFFSEIVRRVASAARLDGALENTCPELARYLELHYGRLPENEVRTVMNEFTAIFLPSQAEVDADGWIKLGDTSSASFSKSAAPAMTG